jgi:hypothetical protein
MVIPWHVRTWRRSAAMLVLGGLCSLVTSAQERLYVEVYEGSTGALVTDLHSTEVIVMEDAQRLPSVEVRLANLPVSLTVILDNSQASARAFDRATDGLRSFIDRLPAGQILSLLVLAPQPRWVVQGTLDPLEIHVALDTVTIERDASSRLLDGLLVATSWLRTEARPVRPVMVLVTADGADPSQDPMGVFERVIEGLRRAGVTAHTLLMSTPRPGSIDRRMTVAEALAQDLSTFTNGTSTKILLGSGLEAPLGLIADAIDARNRELSRQHLIRFDRPVGAARGDLQVKILRLGARYFVTRDGKPRARRTF